MGSGFYASYRVKKEGIGVGSPKLVIRLDIDTTVCMRPGVENLLILAKEKGVHFTFFANMGRAICYKSTLLKMLRSGHGGKTESAPKLSPIDKLGLKGLLITMLFNPVVGKGYPQVLRRLVNEGHDLGLHGGRNHGEWHHNAAIWDKAKVEKEVEWGVSAIKAVGLPDPVLFASPGFTTPSNIVHVLSSLGFKVLADDHTEDHAAIYVDNENLNFRHVNTRLLGKPGEVGFIESIIASGKTFSEVKEQVEAHLNQGDDVIMYDHPCLAGGRGLSYLSCIIDIWLDSGARIVPMSELIK